MNSDASIKEKLFSIVCPNFFISPDKRTLSGIILIKEIIHRGRWIAYLRS